MWLPYGTQSYEVAAIKVGSPPKPLEGGIFLEAVCYIYISRADRLRDRPHPLINNRGLSSNRSWGVYFTWFRGDVLVCEGSFSFDRTGYIAGLSIHYSPHCLFIIHPLPIRVFTCQAFTLPVLGY